MAQDEPASLKSFAIIDFKAGAIFGYSLSQAELKEKEAEIKRLRNCLAGITEQYYFLIKEQLDKIGASVEKEIEAGELPSYAKALQLLKPNSNG